MNSRPFNYPQPQQSYNFNFEYPPPQPLQQYQYNPRLHQPQPPQQQRQHVFSIQDSPQSQNRGHPNFPASQPQPRRTPLSQPPPPPQPHNVRASPETEAGAGTGSDGPMPEAELERQLMDAMNNDTEQQAQQDGLNLEEQYPNQGDDNDPIYQLPPPPEASYPSCEAMEKAMHEWSLIHGYEMVRRASKKNAKGVIYKRYWDCSKHARKKSGVFPENQRRKAKTGTDLQCPMSLATVAVQPSDPSGEWQIRHRKTHHNHPAQDAKLLAGHRRRFRDENVQRAIDGLFTIGTSTAQVVQFLEKTNPNGLFTRTDVANMKLKWKKYGTCSVKHGEGADALAKKTPNYAGACHRCRLKHQACDSVQPVCTNCQQLGAECTYDERRSRNDTEMDIDERLEDSSGNAAMPVPGPEQQPSDQNTAPARSERGRPNQTTKALTIEILEQLRSAQKEKWTPERLDMQSSTVEILAQSSCGTGTSYDSLPLLASPNEWPIFRDAVIDASLKENMYEVLQGAKTEPQKPGLVAGEDGTPAEVEAWNEYIKQLAIYRRRNEMLLSALRSHMTPYYRGRIMNLTTASAVWDTLEDLFQPRGCETAFKLFLELNSIKLDNSNDLKDYIHRLQTTYEKIKQLPLNTSPTSASAHAPRTPRPRDGSEAMPEEMVCLLFLQNLGPEWRRWVDGLCATNNIGGFGTGDRLGLKDLCKRAVGYEAMQRRELGMVR